MPKGQLNKRYTAEFKRMVVETMQREKLSYRETERRFELPSQRAVSWERIYLTEGFEGLEIERRGRGSKGHLVKLPAKVEEDLLAEVQRLRAENTTKTKSSMRTLPLVPQFRKALLDLLEKQAANRLLCGRSYNPDYLDYICVDEMGNLIKPSYITAMFPDLLEKNGLRRIRFHDLRHSCASLLLKSGVPMKQIQEWLGHSDFSTTANIYAHLDYSSKLSSAQAMTTVLHLPNVES